MTAPPPAHKWQLKIQYLWVKTASALPALGPVSLYTSTTFVMVDSNELELCVMCEAAAQQMSACGGIAGGIASMTAAQSSWLQLVSGCFSKQTRSTCSFRFLMLSCHSIQRCPQHTAFLL